MSIDPWNYYVKDEFTQFIDKSTVKTIFEIGARECGYTQEIIDCYTDCEELHSFECNIYTIPECYKNIEQLKRNNSKLKKFKLATKGISSKKETLTFFPVLVGNDYGSSSVGFYPTEKNHSILHNKQYTVDCITIDDYCTAENITSVDLLLLDIEGGELKALQGAKNTLNTTSYIIAETQDTRRYENTPLRSEIIEFLKPYGFKEVYTTCDGYFGDSIFIK